MKKNFPVTNHEITFPKDEEIISTTDLKGAITSYNETFLNMSGFTPDELKGVNHNIVRHPDMPEAAFADLWQDMKSNKHWMGIVKNRSKNGDHYWVDAYVTPILENGHVTGYESVRSKPSVERVERAEKVYHQLNRGQTPKIGGFLNRISLTSRSIIINFIAICLGLATYSITPSDINILPFFSALLVSTGSFYIGSLWVFSPLQSALKNVQKDINNPLMALIYTGRDDEIGQIQLPAELLKAKLKTILGRMKDAADHIEQNAASSANALSEINTSIQHQANETDLVATAMTEMTATVQDVACSASHAAKKADDADLYSKQGVQHASGAASGLQGLTKAVHDVSDVVSQLDNETQNIGTVVDVIKGIAEQTNLLALNAAIEAARAGDQGRGFAVVADEVRTLAGRTQESTQKIQQLIENLNATVAQAVTVMSNSEEAATNSEKLVSKAISSLSLIAEQVNGLNDINMQIASAVEQQGVVSEEINKNVVQISYSAEKVLSGTNSADTAAKSLSQQSHKLTEMIQRFKMV